MIIRMVLFLFILIICIEIGATISVIIIYGSLITSLLWGSPYMGIPRNSLQEILSFGSLTKDDVFYDLGAGDARVIISAKETFGAKKVVGYEISPWPYFKGRKMIKSAELQKAVIFERKNIFSTDLSDATFIYLYLFTSFINEKVAPKLANELKQGAKILSCSSQIDLKRYPMFELLKSSLIGNIHVYLYKKV